MIVGNALTVQVKCCFKSLVIRRTGSYDPFAAISKRSLWLFCRASRACGVGDDGRFAIRGVANGTDICSYQAL